MAHPWNLKSLLLVWVCLAAPPLQAHDLIIERNSNFRAEPSSSSELLLNLKPGDRLELLEVEPVGGYYRGLHREGVGWVWGRNVTILPEYDRSNYRHWIDQEDSCHNVREAVLVTESEIEVTLSADGCRILSGRWTDPYSGETFTSSNQLDVDHMVPLGNAHKSGAWEWSYKRREEYANDLTYPEHLITVKSSVNRSKGSKGPDEWKPPRESYWCEYATNWEAIKGRWKLSMTESEKNAVMSMKANCP